jgi:flagellar biosynthesis protein FlhF
MRLKSFYGPTTNEAMRLVREALGENAIIVATRDDEAGGIRITAAIDDTPPPDGLEYDGANADNRGSEVIEIIAEALLRHEVPHALAERLLAAAMQSANDDPMQALAAAFNTHLRFQPILKDEAGKPLIFIGPPGAGKTLCAAKFATNATLAKKPVIVISTDTERAGGMEQLAAFTRLLKIGLMEIEDAQTLHEAVAIQPEDALIVIDTPGRNPFIEAERHLLSPLVKAAGGEAILVLPADMDSNEALDMVQEFRPLGAARLLMTRLDTTRRLGNLLRLAFESRLPLANFTATPKVTEAPESFDPLALARLVLPPRKEGQA